MKKPLLFLMIFFAISCFGANDVFAQTKPEKVFYVELFLPDRLLNFRDKFEVPAGYDFEKNNPDNTLTGGAFATTHCVNCPLSAEYSFWVVKAEKITDEKLVLEINASFTNRRRCNTNREISVNPQKRETINLKCGVKLVTYSAVSEKSK